MKRTIHCKHFRAPINHKTCAAGVKYTTLGPISQWPCVISVRDGKIHPGCDLVQYPTPEEIAAEDARSEVRNEKHNKARKAIVEHLGSPWRRGVSSTNGVINCPACGGIKTLGFSRSGYNGHIHARCETQGCVSWME